MRSTFLAIVLIQEAVQSFRLVPKSVTLNDLERRNCRYCALSYRIWQSCQASSSSWSRRFLVLVLVFVLTCMVLFNNVWSCIMLLVTKLRKNLIHHANTICAILSCYVTLYTCRYYIQSLASLFIHAAIMFACNNLHMTDMRAKKQNILKAINK